MKRGTLGEILWGFFPKYVVLPKRRKILCGYGGFYQLYYLD
jgi:hypothetical protein